jgi:ABC-type bacteriocin/lantibiotic exporter with double-glycine peptidase domain
VLLYFEIFKNLNKKLKLQFLVILFLIFISFFLELLSISSLFPFLLAISDIEFFIKYQNEINKYLSFLNYKIDFSTNEKVLRNNIIFFSCIFLFFIFFLKNIFLTYYYYKKTKFTGDINIFFSSKIFFKLINLDFRYFRKLDTAEFLRSVNNSSYLVNGIDNILLLVLETLVICGLFTMLLSHDPSRVILLLIFFLLFSFISIKFFKNYLINISKKRYEFEGKRYNSIINAFNGYINLHLLAKNNDFHNNYNLNNSNVQNASNKIAFLNLCIRPYFELAFIIGFIFIVISFLSTDSSKFPMITTLGFFAAVSLRIIPSIGKIVASFQYIKSSQYPIMNILKIFKTDHVKIEYNKIDTTDKKLQFQNLSFKKVFFSYDQKYKLLSNLNLIINRGDIIGILGESGIGKTTFFCLIAGLLKPSKGKILLNGKDIEENLPKWRSIIGYLPQETFLMNATVLENIVFDLEKNLNIEKNEINKLLNLIKICKLEKFFKNNNLKSKIREFGKNISIGQKQRLGIARALYSDPQILLLDEPTSSLDKITANQIITNIKNYNKKNITVIIISHNLKSLSICNKIYEFKNSKIKKIK